MTARWRVCAYVGVTVGLALPSCYDDVKKDNVIYVYVDAAGDDVSDAGAGANVDAGSDAGGGGSTGICADGDTLECGERLGLCKPGVQRCRNGQWGACEDVSADQKRVRPATEVCDGQDNDCDGDIDEGCNCEDGNTQECGETLGLCKPGIQRCRNGQWGSCEDVSADQKRIRPTTEVCDGQDNDCDGDIDEGCDCLDGDSLECGQTLGLCKPGVQRCRSGKWGPCEDVSADQKRIRPTTEVCDGQDNNCDGDVDEGCDCVPSAVRWCNGGDGVCRSGKQACEAGLWGPCLPVQPAALERCDGLDNDCNGVVDEGFDLDVPCNSIGKCPQSRVCSADGASSSCVDDPKLFTEEVCDGVDNDCDGLVDRVADGGTLRSVCECQGRTLAIGAADDASIPNNHNLCQPTLCSPDRPLGLLVDGRCFPSCLTNSDPDGDGFGFENGMSCLVPTSPRGSAAPPCNGIPVGMAMTYCLNCDVTDDLPYAMCQSQPRFDLRAFARGQLWLSIDYTFSAATIARTPINLWFHAGGLLRKHLPLVRIGDVPGRFQAVLRAQDACFTPSAVFGPKCADAAKPCAHCGSDEACGSLTECGDYDLSQAWLQVAAEFCARGSGQHTGTVTINSVAVVAPNCSM